MLLSLLMACGTGEPTPPADAPDSGGEADSGEDAGEDSGEDSGGDSGEDSGRAGGLSGEIPMGEADQLTVDRYYIGRRVVSLPPDAGSDAGRIVATGRERFDDDDGDTGDGRPEHDWIWVLSNPLPAAPDHREDHIALDGDRDELLDAGDVDGDGAADLVTTARDEDQIVLWHLPFERFGSLALPSVSDEDPLRGVVVDVTGDGQADLLVGDPQYAVAASEFRGQVLLTEGPLGAGDHALGSAVVVGELASDWLGGSLTSVGDLDGDGLDEVALYAHGDRGDARGATHVCSGNCWGTGTLESADALVVDNVSVWSFATAFRAGDINGDGRDNLCFDNISIYGDADGTQIGLVTCFTDALSGERMASDAEVWVETPYSPEAGPAGDVDADGSSDLLVRENRGYDDPRMYILSCPTDGTYELKSDALAVVLPNSPFAAFTDNPTTVGDWSGDGIDDFAVANWEDEDESYLGVFYGGLP